MNPRAVAVSICDSVLFQGQSLTTVLSELSPEKTKDLPFIKALCYGVIRWYPRLTYWAGTALKFPLKPKDNDILLLLCVGIYQLWDMKIPDYVAISETVNATKDLKKLWAKKLVNAVLRNFQRNQKTLTDTTSFAKHEESYYAHPQWLIHNIKEDWASEADSILIANNEHPPLSLRVNLNKVSRENYLKDLEAVKISAHIMPSTHSGIILEIPQDIKTLPGFKEGLFTVQDGASQYIPSLLRLKANQTILDACAAPGGKTTHLLEIEPSLAITAIDIDIKRTQLIQENLHRLQLKANVIAADASKPDTWWDKKLFDRILIDAPCSATGIIRRHPDIKFLRKAKDIKQYAKQQLDLLKALFPLLQPGGLLLYSTCSILRAENEDVIEAFLKDHENAKIVSITLNIGMNLRFGRQILPGQNEMDGFYFALITK